MNCELKGQLFERNYSLEEAPMNVTRLTCLQTAICGTVTRIVTLTAKFKGNRLNLPILTVPSQQTPTNSSLLLDPVSFIINGHLLLFTLFKHYTGT